jgi:hypothetical protein
MKKLLLLLPIGMFLAACSKKDVKHPLTPQNATAADIMGTWQIVADTIHYAATNGETQITAEDKRPDSLLLTYGANGVATQTAGKEQLPSLTYTIANGVIKQILNTQQEVDFDIREITTTRMIVRFSLDNNYEDVELDKK